MIIALKCLDSTENFAKQFATALLALKKEYKRYPAILHFGGLGSGKTTFTKYLVNSFENAENAEISSPSFTLYNIYPTIPCVVHFDLYKNEGMPLDEAFFEYTSDETVLSIIEWSEHIQTQELPAFRIELHWKILATGREIFIKTFGFQAELFFEKL